MRTSLRLLVLAAAAAGSSCVTANVTTLATTVYPAVPAESVTVLADISEITNDTVQYERIAIIHTKGSGGGFTDATDLLHRAREEAGKLGANAVIVSGYTQGNYNVFWGTTSPNEGSAIAIRYWRRGEPPLSSTPETAGLSDPRAGMILFVLDAQSCTRAYRIRLTIDDQPLGPLTLEPGSEPRLEVLAGQHRVSAREDVVNGLQFDAVSLDVVAGRQFVYRLRCPA